MESDLKKIFVREKSSIKEAMTVIDRGGIGMALIVDASDKLLGIVTDGIIRRAILNGIDIEKQMIDSIMNKKPLTVHINMSDQQIIDAMIGKNVIGKVPVLDNQGKVVDLAMVPYASIPSSNQKNIPYIARNSLLFFKKSSFTPKPVNKVLIIGGAGYLGSVLSRKLLDRNYNVRVFDKLIFGVEPIIDLLGNKNFELIKGDMCNITEVSDALENVDAVIHLAGIVGDPASSINPKKTVESNYIATKIIAELCKYNQINRFIFSSSCSVYGASDEIINEESYLNPLSLYARSKIGSEKGVLELVDNNFSPTILRMGTLYGLSPRMRFDLVINLLIAKALKEKSFTIFGGEQWRPFIHVDDAAEAYIKVLETPIEIVKGEIFNLGDDRQNYKLKDIAHYIKELIPETKLNFDENAQDVRNYKVSFEKIRNAIKFESKKEIKDTISEIENVLKDNSMININDNYYNNYLKQLEANNA